MQTTNRFLDDLAKVANGAVSTLSGVKGEIEALVHQRLERVLLDMDLVPRDEFDAVKAMAAKARAEQEKLEARLARLEGKAPAKPRTKPRTKPRAKAATKKAAKAGKATKKASAKKTAAKKTARRKAAG